MENKSTLSDRRVSSDRRITPRYLEDESVLSSRRDLPVRRTSPRISAAFPVEVKIKNISNDIPFVIKGETTNISENGVGLILREPLPSYLTSLKQVPIELAKNNEKEIFKDFFEKDITLSAKLPSDITPTETKMQLVWIGEKNQENLDFGAKFVKIGKEERNNIMQYLEKSKLRFKKDDLIPRKKNKNYELEFVTERRKWLSEKTGAEFSHISCFSTESEEYKGNIENFVGVAQVPIGIVGPLLVKGDFANGIFYVPFATTEGALVGTYQRGAVALTKSGGVRTFINKDENHLDPIFLFQNHSEARDFVFWLKNNFLRLKEVAESTTGFGKLVNITPHIVGRRVITDFAYNTGDAMGANMINIATEKVCEFIAGEVKIERYLLRSNFSSEKKASAVNLLIGYGKEVIVEAVVPAEIVQRFLFSTPEDIATAWHSWALSSFHSAILGPNAHFANGLAAIFIACGQDVAHIVNASIGIQSYEITKSGDLYMSIKLPNIIVGTVGGGTALGTQRECLEMMDCYGKGKAGKFAEIVGAALLAGELGICSGITTKHFQDPHKSARIHTREKAYQKEG